jgi:hypothetical protein
MKDETDLKPLVLSMWPTWETRSDWFICWLARILYFCCFALHGFFDSFLGWLFFLGLAVGGEFLFFLGGFYPLDFDRMYELRTRLLSYDASMTGSPLLLPGFCTLPAAWFSGPGATYGKDLVMRGGISVRASEGPSTTANNSSSAAWGWGYCGCSVVVVLLLLITDHWSRMRRHLEIGDVTDRRTSKNTSKSCQKHVDPSIQYDRSNRFYESRVHPPATSCELWVVITV